MEIRDAEASDMAQIASIYSYYVRETPISFEEEAPSAEAMKRRWLGISKEYPYLVATDGDRILGYAYAHRFHERAAYRRSAEVTIYLNKEEKGQGIGRSLYQELERRLGGTGVHNLYALVTYPGFGSVEFHKKMGYEIAGILTDCGEKLGRLWSVAYMEKRI